MAWWGGKVSGAGGFAAAAAAGADQCRQWTAKPSNWEYEQVTASLALKKAFGGKLWKVLVDMLYPQPRQDQT